jgi:YHS domain-containing protein
MKNYKIFLLVLILVFICAQNSFGAVKTKAVKSKEIKCPITGNKVDPAKTKLKTTYKGKTYYFCCAGCPEEFKKNPVKYTK